MDCGPTGVSARASSRCCARGQAGGWALPMGRARSMPCDISNYSNVSSDLGSWYLDVLLFFGFSRSNISLHARRARTSFVFGLTHRVRSGSRDDCACMAPGCRLSRLLPAMRCVAGRRILKLIKRLDSVTSPRGVGATDGLPRTNPDPVPRPRPPTFRAGPGPRRSLVDMSGDPLGTARARARAASVSRFQIEFQKDSSERVLRYTWRALGRIDDVRHGAASGTFPRRRGCI